MQNLKISKNLHLFSGNDKIYANVSEEFHKFVNALKGREEQKLRLDETFQVVEVKDKVRKKSGGQSFFGSISQQPPAQTGRLKNANTFAATGMSSRKPSKFSKPPTAPQKEPTVRSRGSSNLNAAHSQKLNDFLKNVLSVLPVDYSVPKLKFNRFPASVNMKSKLVHVHYLFQMLGVGVIFVVDDSNILYGKISREDFINLRYKKPKYKTLWISAPRLGSKTPRSKGLIVNSLNN